MADRLSEDGDGCDIVGSAARSERDLPDASKSAFNGASGRRWVNVNANCAAATFAVVMEVAYDHWISCTRRALPAV